MGPLDPPKNAQMSDVRSLNYTVDGSQIRRSMVVSGSPNRW